MNTEEKQKMIDLIFSIGIHTHTYKSLQNMPREKYAEWVAKQLRDLGYDTEPMGMSWGVLKK